LPDNPGSGFLPSPTEPLTSLIINQQKKVGAFLAVSLKWLIFAPESGRMPLSDF
jgi:hypothetical protein